MSRKLLEFIDDGFNHIARQQLTECEDYNLPNLLSRIPG